MSEIGVVHLARASNGLQPLSEFMATYRRYPGEMEHRLVIVLKGFSDLSLLAGARDLLKNTPHEQFLIDDVGFDIHAYAAAAQAFDFDYFVFLNSFSRLRDPEWLAKLYRHASRENVGLVGATGSWESPYSSFRKDVGARLNDLSSAQAIRLPFSLLKLVHLRLNFDPFPNYHVRTNAFMLRRTLFNTICRRRIRSKFDAWCFESGKKSMTQQIHRMGLKSLIVGKDGKGYEKELWHASGVFRQDRQDNLLVADNRTQDYLNASPETRRKLSWDAWGTQSRPLTTKESHADIY